MLTLRPYQNDAVASAAHHARLGRRPLICAPVGSGKTVIGSEIVRRAVARDRRVLWLTHTGELLDQSLGKIGVAGIIKAGRKPDPQEPVQIATVQTLARRELPPADVVIADEAHLAAADTWTRILREYESRNSSIVGLSATPSRLDGQPLRPLFTTLVVPITPRELAEQGHLLDPRYLGLGAPDLRRLTVRAGDFAPGEAGEMMSAVVGDLPTQWRKHTKGGLTIAFASSIKHSQKITAAFKDQGIGAAHLDGAATPNMRRKMLEDFRAGHLRVLVNCNILGMGFDLPELEAVILARPTMSWALHTQQVGRVMRPAPGKEQAVVLDHVGNHSRHGLPLDDRTLTLDGEARDRQSESVTKTCPVCFNVEPTGAQVCRMCGEEFKPETRSEIRKLGGDLVEVKKATDQDKATLMETLLREARRRGYQRGWAARRYRAEFGVLPRGKWYGPLVKTLIGGCKHAKRSPTGGCLFCREGTPLGEREWWARGKERW